MTSARHMGWRRLHDERGASLVIALMVTMLMSVLVGALVLGTATETTISTNHRTGQESLYAADAGIELVVQDLLDEPQWNPVLAGVATSSFHGSSTTPTLPDGRVIDLSAETNALQLESDQAALWPPNDPVWRLYAHGALQDLLPAGEVGSQSYVAVWIADDPAETDGNPQRDTNDTLTLRAIAYGPFNTRRMVDATVGLASSSTTGDNQPAQRGGNALNQGARTGTVGRLGDELARSSMSTSTGGMAP